MIDTFLEFLRSLTDPERLIRLLSTILSGWLGYTALFAVVFAETGLLVGFFLPGDSLLFTVGVVSGAGQLNIVLVNVLLMSAAIMGDSLNYWLGRSAGPRIFNRPNSRFFRREHLLHTKEFYDKHGRKTIIFARFLPIIRTFAPFVAGVSGMSYARFITYSVAGSVGWVFFMTMLGYQLGSVPIIRAHFEKVIVLIIVVSLAPAVSEFLKARRKAAAR